MVHFSTLVLFSLLSLSVASPVPESRSGKCVSHRPPTPPGRPSHLPHHKKCKHPVKRKPWQSLSKKEKKDYIDAELCLMSKPSKSGLEGTVTRFDDLVKPHQVRARVVHNSGYFFPFHRAHMHAHEMLLRTECGYKGYQPYWAEELDLGRIQDSDVFDPVTGFGGNGTGPDNCIQDGPFKDYQLNTGPGFKNTPHCIKRLLLNEPTYAARQEYALHCHQFEKYAQASQCLESGGTHLAFHSAVGGEMSNPISSPGDPLFYLHHTWLDKKWWDWQKENPERIYDIGGGKDGYVPGLDSSPPPGVFPPGFEKLNLTLLFPDGAPLPGIPFMPPPPGVLPPRVVMPVVNTSAPPSWRPPNVPVEDPVVLEDVIDMLGVIPSPLVADVMDIQGGYLCYEYEEHPDVV